MYGKKKKMQLKYQCISICICIQNVKKSTITCKINNRKRNINFGTSTERKLQNVILDFQMEKFCDCVTFVNLYA